MKHWYCFQLFIIIDGNPCFLIDWFPWPQNEEGTVYSYWSTHTTFNLDEYRIMFRYIFMVHTAILMKSGAYVKYVSDGLKLCAYPCLPTQNINNLRPLCVLCSDLNYHSDHAKSRLVKKKYVHMLPSKWLRRLNPCYIITMTNIF